MSKSIFIADDNGQVRKLVREFLEAETDCKVVGEAKNGVEAIEQAKELKPDLILLDFLMPGLNGVEAASILKNMFPNVPIVMFTVYDDVLGTAVSEAAGVDLVVSKIGT
jgi:DNA-binding NarL/FixJ family response regulator